MARLELTLHDGGDLSVLAVGEGDPARGELAASLPAAAGDRVVLIGVGMRAGERADYAFEVTGLGRRKVGQGGAGQAGGSGT